MALAFLPNLFSIRSSCEWMSQHLLLLFGSYLTHPMVICELSCVRFQMPRFKDACLSRSSSRSWTLPMANWEDSLAGNMEDACTFFWLRIHQLTRYNNPRSPCRLLNALILFIRSVRSFGSVLESSADATLQGFSCMVYKAYRPVGRWILWRLARLGEEHDTLNLPPSWDYALF